MRLFVVRGLRTATQAEVHEAVVVIDELVEHFSLYGRERLVPRLSRFHFQLL